MVIRNARFQLLPAVLLALWACCVPADADAGTKLCCFNNWRFSGSCVVQIGDGESCGDVLGVLDNMMSAPGYCGGTTIRGGWATVECGSTVSDGSPQPPAAIEPVQPSSTAPASSPRRYVPDEQPSTSPSIESQSPTFITPVDPATAVEAKGPSLITLN
jgi:hypothetical protein